MLGIRHRTSCLGRTPRLPLQNTGAKSSPGARRILWGLNQQDKYIAHRHIRFAWESPTQLCRNIPRSSARCSQTWSSSFCRQSALRDMGQGPWNLSCSSDLPDRRLRSRQPCHICCRTNQAGTSVVHLPGRSSCPGRKLTDWFAAAGFRLSCGSRLTHAWALVILSDSKREYRHKS